MLHNLLLAASFMLAVLALGLAFWFEVATRRACKAWDRAGEALDECLVAIADFKSATMELKAELTTL